MSECVDIGTYARERLSHERSLPVVEVLVLVSNDPAAALPTVEDALALGLTRAEYALICAHQSELTGHPPNQVELAMYSLLWSEHCAYKHSKNCCARSRPRARRGHGSRRERRCR